MASKNFSLRNKQPLTSTNNSSSNKRSKCNDSVVEVSQKDRFALYLGIRKDFDARMGLVIA
ncbi:uncharacterized protein G2W53_039740 [Senna tora]|uniref:Uncharacterized protein n=1 Tax=Senna tora TaxID=362788 RepID=A0A834SP32_9FABA|nr:uncharacterized protein G2W53_039740 [Senna tora]